MTLKEKRDKGEKGEKGEKREKEEKEEREQNIGKRFTIFIISFLGLVSIISFYGLVSLSFYGLGLVTIASAAYERPAYDQALVAPWHPGGYCIPCHYSLMPKEKAEKISNGCTCHNIRPEGVTSGYMVNMSKIYDIHNDIICIRCHIGMKNQQDVTPQDFHRIMPIECSKCHTYSEGTYQIQIPKKKKCSDCHADGNPHVVHGDKINKLCVACHGESFANKYINTTIEITAQGIVKTPTNNTTIEYPTITDIIGRILDIILKIGH